jgi:hypothetical protein
MGLQGEVREQRGGDRLVELTRGGLQANFEANILVRSSEVVSQIVEYFDEYFLGARAELVDEDWLASYRDLYKRRKRIEDSLRRISQEARRIK